MQLLPPTTLARLAGVAGGIGIGAVASTAISDAAEQRDTDASHRAAFGGHAALAATTYFTSGAMPASTLPLSALKGAVTGASLMLTLGTVTSGMRMLAEGS